MSERIKITELERLQAIATPTPVDRTTTFTFLEAEISMAARNSLPAFLRLARAVKSLRNDDPGFTGPASEDMDLVVARIAVEEALDAFDFGDEP